MKRLKISLILITIILSCLIYINGVIKLMRIKLNIANMQILKIIVINSNYFYKSTFKRNSHEYFSTFFTTIHDSRTV